MSKLSTVEITPEQRRQYREEGYFILERALSGDQLDLLRGFCQGLIDEIDAEMDARGVTSDHINIRGNRYFISNASQRRPQLLSFLTSDLMLDVCRATVGDDAYLIWEQYVIKAAESGKSFGWHQDSGYSEYDGHDFWPGVSCWCPLDDVDESNGTVYILPYARTGGNKLMPHVTMEGVNDLVGYHGDEPGVPVVIPAGGMAVFSLLTFHRSGANRTDRMRRVYLAQYAVKPPRSRATGQQIGPALHVLRDGGRATG